MSFRSRKGFSSVRYLVNPGMMRQELVALFVSVAFINAFFHSKPCIADWPGLLGANRDGKASEESRLADTMNGNPEIVWQIPAGQGYAGASVIDRKVCLFDRDGSQDRVRLVQLNDGKVLWTKTIPARYSGGIDADKGPRCVPTLLEKSIVLYSASGDISALAMNDGSVRWTRKLKEEYNGDDGYFGAGSSPLAIGNKLIVNAGGKKAGIVCLNAETGATIWQATQADASYASPIRFRTTTYEQIVVPTRYTTYGLDVESGKELWSTSFGQRGPTVNAATPIALGDDSIFLTASYGIGNLVLQPNKNAVRVVEKGSRLSSQYATPILLNNKIFGSDGREDYADGSYKCLSAISEKVEWEQSEMPICHSIGINDKLLLVGIDGRLWSLDTKASKFTPIWMSSLPAGNYRSMPAYEGSLLITRSSQTWIAVRLGNQ
ncbi:MAG: PQQ-binding-like beta-propeller repeat protein [Pirellula sp.]|nr:PQQ-binding-like beta-propeller repeat protein [Pirellula sp.]